MFWNMADTVQVLTRYKTTPPPTNKWVMSSITCGLWKLVVTWHANELLEACKWTTHKRHANKLQEACKLTVKGRVLLEPNHGLNVRNKKWYTDSLWICWNNVHNSKSTSQCVIRFICYLPPHQLAGIPPAGKMFHELLPAGCVPAGNFPAGM